MLIKKNKQKYVIVNYIKSNNIYNEIYEYLLKCEDITLKRKVISKMVDSFRIDDTTKERFKGLR